MNKKLTAKEKMILRAKEAKKKKEEEEKKSREVTVSSLEKVEIRHKFNLNLCDDININKFLNEKSDKLYLNEVNSNIAAGKILNEVHNELSGSNRYDGLYLEWLKAIDYNPRTALRHRIRYVLFTKAKTEKNKELFATLPVRILEKLHSHSEKDYFVSLIENGEIKNKKDLEGYLDSDETKEGNSKIKPITTFYKPIFSFEKKIDKMTNEESHKALEELREVKKEILRLEKILKSKEEETLNND